LGAVRVAGAVEVVEVVELTAGADADAEGREGADDAAGLPVATVPGPVEATTGADPGEPPVSSAKPTTATTATTPAAMKGACLSP
jgi:hypothetical protein